MKKSIIVVLGVSSIIYSLIIFCYKTIDNVNRIDHDEDLLYSVTQAFCDVDSDMYYVDEEDSINSYNSFFDGHVHYLHEIDENTEFGKLMLKRLAKEYYEHVSYNVSTFEEFESKIRTVKKNKSFALYYTDDGYLHVYIPNSYSCPIPFIKGKGIYEKIKLRYL